MKYIKTLHLVNFQSHKDSIIDLHPGLNIFVGESDQGKTAIIRALRWLIYNEPRGNAFIRVGETGCSVTATLSNGTKITRLRDESKRQNRYIIKYPESEELVLEKFKNEVPIEVQKELGISPLWIDTDQKTELNIARQLDNPFLIAESPANRAKIIGRIANLHIIDAAQRELLRDIRSLGRSKADLEKDIVDLETQKEQYQDMPQKEQQLLRIKQQLGKLKHYQTQVNQLEELKKHREQVISKLQNNNKQLLKLHNIDDLILRYEKLVASVSFYKKLTKHQVEQKKVKSDLSQHLETIKRLDNLGEINDKHQQCLKVINMYSELQSLRIKQHENQFKLIEINTYLKAASNLPRAEQLIAKLYDLRQVGYNLQQQKIASRQLSVDINQKRNELSIITNKLKTLQQIDKAEHIINKQVISMEKLVILSEHYRQIERTKQKIRQNNTEMTALDENYKKMQQKFTELLSEAGTCPTCGSRITPLVIKEIIKKEMEGERNFS